MTTAVKAQILENVRVFKSVNHNQRKQYMADRLRHIADCIDSYVDDYNANRLIGEPEITMQEMIEQLARKVGI
jgi:hypothetical protein